MNAGQVFGVALLALTAAGVFLVMGRIHRWFERRFGRSLGGVLPKWEDQRSALAIFCGVIFIGSLLAAARNDAFDSLIAYVLLALVALLVASGFALFFLRRHLRKTPALRPRERRHGDKSSD